ncbi:response regulator [Dyadobacter luteus]|jgi:CheY-like chemotaxis protein|uniref:Response regulator n=1 Tax=Dyadobacter luteus TaxID=2259619 RepID=A0A3D8YEB9_9BACT|nr:response regulator [Dyadobacter luteus]REA62907.1 response regulator [Dyadobacter luteus]
MKTQSTLYLVDDDEDDRLFLSEAVRKTVKNVVIIECKDGVEFLEKLGSEPQIAAPVLVLMDMNMPFMNGLETIKKLKSVPALQSIPVIFISTSSSPDLQSQAFEAGATDFLIKPSTSVGLNQIALNIENQFAAFL